jgi:hypothetical protein
MYVGTNKLGIGTGIGMQAFADIPEYVITGGGPVTKRSSRPPRAALGACCAKCAGAGTSCAALSGLGAVTLTSSVVGLQTKPPAPILGGAGGGGSTLVKIALLGGIVVGGVFLYKKLRKKS